MKKELLLIASMVMTAPAANAIHVAGWDFSQFYVAGRLSIDGTTPVTSLDANYSSFDPTGNAGAESAAYGELDLTGASVVPMAQNVADYLGNGDAEDIPSGEGAIEANLDGPGTAPGTNWFNSFSVLEAEGQANTELLALRATAATTLTFEVDPFQGGGAGTQGVGQDYSVSFGARARSGGSGTVGVSFATDCSSYGGVTNVAIDETDTEYSVSFPNSYATTGCVRMDLSEDAILDNVSVDVISLPEPGALMGFLAGALALVGLRRIKA